MSATASSAGADAVPTPQGRRGYLDWLRGIAVAIMVLAHTADSWTDPAERSRALFRWTILLGGMGAPLFLFLAGIALMLAAGSRQRRGASASAVFGRALRRGAEIYALAFLFELQSWAVSGGSFARKMLRVDILHVMGVSMLVAALLWRAGRSARTRALLFAGCTVLVAMVTPVVRGSAAIGAMPEIVQWYLTPVPGRATFTLLPWSGFLFAGAAVGVLLDRCQTRPLEARLNLTLLAAGPVLAAVSAWAAMGPSLYRASSFWTSSPAFFFIRLGVLVAALPAAFALAPRETSPSPVRQLGVSSLFVYWVHVEMVYGLLSGPLHGRLTVEEALAACLLFTVFLYLLVRLKHRLWDLPEASRRALAAPSA